MFTLEKGDNNKYKIVISADKNAWEEFINQAYEENKNKFTVQGFRKGKAPRKVIEQNYGSTIFFDEALDKLFYQEYANILEQHKEIIPVDNPQISIDKFDDNGIVLLVEIQSVPEVVLGQYKGLEVEGAKGEVDNKQIEDEINQQRDKLARFVEVERPAKLGDFATIDFVGSVDGVKFDGGSAEDYRLELGSHSFINGFEEQIVGMNIGEKKIINVKFPDDYFSENLKGKPAEFEVILNKLEEKELPKLDDEFASNVSEFETLKDYREDIKKHLEESLKLKIKRENENKIIDLIVKNSNVEIPQCMIDNELDKFIKDFEMRLSYQGVKLDEYLTHIGMNLEQLKKDRTDMVKETIKTRLVLEKIIQVENLIISEDELNAKLTEIASKYKKSLEDYKKSLGERELIYFENGILMEKLTSFLTKENKII